MAAFDLGPMTGGQAYAQWRDVEPAPGRYDFSPFAERLALARRAGVRLTVQINANAHPRWLFDAVPYLPAVLKGTRDETGTLVYWHPAYRRAHFALLEAFSAWLRDSPDREAVAGIRMSFLGVGTEGLRIPPRHRSPQTWVHPEGVTRGTPWTQRAAQEYVAEVTAYYLDHVAPVHFTFVRRALVQDASAVLGDDATGHRLVQRIEAGLAAGTLGLFHTSSEVQPRNGGFSRSTFLTMGEYCRDRRAVCYAEARGNARAFFDDFPATVPPTPGQWFYWRMLADLHLGISRLAVAYVDLERGNEPGFRDGLDVAHRYAGAYLDPRRAAGAWIAFRAGDFLPGDYRVHASSEGCGTRASGLGPSGHPYGLWATTLLPGEHCAVRFEAAPFEAFAAPENGPAPPLRLRLRMHNPGTAPVSLTLGGWGRERRLIVDGDDGWETRELAVTAAAAGAATRGEPLRIAVRGGAVNLHLVELRRDTPPRRRQTGGANRKQESAD